MGENRRKKVVTSPRQFRNPGGQIPLYAKILEQSSVTPGSALQSLAFTLQIILPLCIKSSTCFYLHEEFSGSNSFLTFSYFLCLFQSKMVMCLLIQLPQKLSGLLVYITGMSSFRQGVLHRSFLHNRSLFLASIEMVEEIHESHTVSSKKNLYD